MHPAVLRIRIHFFPEQIQDPNPYKNQMDPEHWYPEKSIIRPYRVALQNPEEPIISQEILKIYAPILRSHFSEFCRGVKKKRED